MHTSTKIIFSGDVSCGLMKIKLKCMAIMTIITFGGKTRKLPNLITPKCEV